MKKFILLLLPATILFASCKKHGEGGIFKGPAMKVFEGKAWTWIQLDPDGSPMRAAISINEDALNSVSMDAGHQQQLNNTVLKFHPKAEIADLKHAWLNWNPMGHPPPGIYDPPHFDFHFYMVSSEEREAYVDTVKLGAQPPAQYIPVNHIGVDPIPMMGLHFVDTTAPEFHGEPFTQTFIYGSYDTKLVFFEPMITLEFLKNTTGFERAIPQPAAVQKSGYYPTRMRIENVAGTVSVILEGFFYREAS